MSTTFTIDNMPSVEPSGQSKLEEIGKLTRDQMLRDNKVYGSYSDGSPSQLDDTSKIYSKNHTNAKSDGPAKATSPDEIDKGKGTNEMNTLKVGSIDTKNGGSSTDIYGRTDILTSGRRGQQKLNYYKYGKAYYTDIKVDTTKNKGQFKLK